MPELCKTFRVDLDAKGRRMTCTVEGATVEEAISRASERMAVDFASICEIQIKTDGITVKMTPVEKGDRT